MREGARGQPRLLFRASSGEVVRIRDGDVEPALQAGVFAQMLLESLALLDDGQPPATSAERRLVHPFEQVDEQGFQIRL
jgi:hypothetical protein